MPTVPLYPVPSPSMSKTWSENGCRQESRNQGQLCLWKYRQANSVYKNIQTILGSKGPIIETGKEHTK